MAREMKANPSGEKKLEQYGVWVKIEPRELSESQRGEGSFELTDLETPSQAETPSEDTLTAEEEELLDELETEISHEESPMTEGPAEPKTAEAVFETEDLGSVATTDLGALGSEPAAADEAETGPLGLKPDMGEEVLPDLDLDDLGAPEISRVEETAEEDAGKRTRLLGEDVLELPEEAFPGEGPASVELPDIGEEVAVEGLPTELPMEENLTTDVEVPLSEELPQEEHFDDLAALEEELATVTSTTSEAVKPGASFSGEILSRIEEELKSIRMDLTQLKNELTSLKKTSKAPKEEAGQESEAGGFFDEDEDETISLTGDELDNILSTAEITEEPAEGAVLESELEGEADQTPESPAETQDILNYDATGGTEAFSQPSETEAAIEELPQNIAPEAGESESALNIELEPLEIEGEPPAEAVPPEAGLESMEIPTQETKADSESAIELGMELEALPEMEKSAEAPSEEIESLDLEGFGEEGTDKETPSLDLEALPEIEEPEAAVQVPAPQEEEASPLDLDLAAITAEEGEEKTATAEADVDELEVMPEESETGKIEIPFEEEGVKPASPAEEALGVEEVPEMEASEQAGPRQPGAASIPEDLKDEIRTVLKYMDQLLEALPEEKIQEFAGSEYFVMYKKLFEDLGLGE